MMHVVMVERKCCRNRRRLDRQLNVILFGVLIKLFCPVFDFLLRARRAGKEGMTMLNRFVQCL